VCGLPHKGKKLTDRLDSGNVGQIPISRSKAIANFAPPDVDLHLISLQSARATRHLRPPCPFTPPPSTHARRPPHRTRTAPSNQQSGRWGLTGETKDMSRAALHRFDLLCLGGLAIATQLHASPEAWTLARSEPGMAYYLDKESVRMQGAHLAYRILVTFTYDPKLDGARPFKSAQLLRIANCSTREQDTKSFLQFHAPMGEGEPAWEATFDDATLRMEPVEPGSVGAQILEMACSLKESSGGPR
jgi:hypothetical protein